MVYEWSYLILSVIFLTSAFTIKAFSKTVSQQRKFFSKALVSMFFWGVFNFAGVNAQNSSYSLLFYSLMLLSISIMSGFVLLTAYSFLSRPGFLIRFIAIIPSFVLLLVFPFLSTSKSAYGSVLNSNPSVLLWAFSCIIVLLLALFFMRRVVKTVVRRDIKKKVMLFSASVLAMSIMFSFCSFMNLLVFSFLLSVPFILISFLLFR